MSSKTNLSVSMDVGIARELRRWARRTGRSISELINQAVSKDIRRRTLGEACAKLDPVEERNGAELGVREDTKKWPAY